MRRINIKEYYTLIDYCIGEENGIADYGIINFKMFGSDVNDIAENPNDEFNIDCAMKQPYIRKQFVTHSYDVLFHAALRCGYQKSEPTRYELESYLLKTFALDIYNDKVEDENEKGRYLNLEVSHDKNGNITISNMSETLCQAINKILSCVEYGFERHSKEYVLRKFEPCGLTLDEKDALDRECWMI